MTRIVDQETRDRRARLTSAFIAKMHRLYHETRGLTVCKRLDCPHPWAPR